MKILIAAADKPFTEATVIELQKKGHIIESVKLPTLPDDKIQNNINDYLESNYEELKEKMCGCDGFVFITPANEKLKSEDINKTYNKYILEPTEKLLKLAKSCKVKKAVITGSYFSYFAKSWIDKKLCDKHPYIKSLIEQERIALSYNDDNFEVMILELSNMFGAIEGKEPIHKILINTLFNKRKKIYYTKGGSAFITIKEATQAISGALEKGTGGSCYPVAMHNLKWKEFYNIIAKHSGKKAIIVPIFLYKLRAFFTKLYYKNQGLETGLNSKEFIKLLTADTFIKNYVVKNSLNIEKDNIEKAIESSIEFIENTDINLKSVIYFK